MVIVIMTDGRDETAAALKGELGWHGADALPHSIDRIRQLAEAALARREPLIISTRPLLRPERTFVARDLASIRFVSLVPLDEAPGPALREAEEPVVVTP